MKHYILSEKQLEQTVDLALEAGKGGELHLLALETALQFIRDSLEIEPDLGANVETQKD